MDQRKLIAIAAAAAAISPAFVYAQTAVSGPAAPAPSAGNSYTRFGGSVDVVVRRDSGGPASVWGVQPGLARTSRLTWSMKEWISPNLAGTAVLEGAVNADTGTGGTPGLPVPAGTVPGFSFNRTAHVGIGSDNWGYITAGRQFTPMQSVTAGPINDPFGGSWLGGIATVYNKNSSASNALVYSYGYTAEAMLRPAPRNGLGVSAMYSFGEEPSPNNQAGNQYGLSASYGGSNWWAGYGYHRQVGNSATLSTAPVSENPKITHQFVGGAYEFWRLRVSLGLNTGKNSTGTLNRQNVSLGVLWTVSDRGTVRFLHGRANDRTATNGDFRTTQVAYLHDLSKRTGLYVAWGNVDNSAVTSVALSGAIGGVTRGATAQSLAFGVRHNF